MNRIHNTLLTSLRIEIRDDERGIGVGGRADGGRRRREGRVVSQVDAALLEMRRDGESMREGADGGA